MGLITQAIEAKSDQFNAVDFVGEERTFTIERVDVKLGQDQPVSIKMQGHGKVWRPCKGMARVMVEGWGDDEEKWKGRSVTLYRDPTVLWSGKEEGGIRIAAMSHIEKPLKTAVRVSRSKSTVVTIKPLAAPRDAAPQQADQGPTEAEAIAQIEAAADLAELQSVFKSLPRPIAGLPAVIKAKDDRKADLSPKLDPEPDAPEDDEIPL